jgi:glycosyltransferase involved in cell wall biosynthesis
LMAGTPAIVTRVGGMPEAIREGETGIVVPPKDSAALASAMSRVVSDPEVVRQMMRAAAHRDAMARFTRDRMMSEYVSVFTEILSRRPAREVAR